MEPILSIITVVRNDIGGLRRTAGAVLPALESNHLIEWIVWDGGSDFDTIAFANTGLAGVGYLKGTDSGIYDAMNKATRKAVGEWVMYLNAGDSIDIAGMSILLGVLCRSHSDVVQFAARLVMRSGCYIKRPRPAFPYIWHGVTANHQAIVFRRSVLGEAVYDVGYKICGDYALLARLYVDGCVFECNDFLLTDFEVGGLSYQKGNVLRREAWNVQRRILGLPLAWCLISRLIHLARKYLTSRHMR